MVTSNTPSGERSSIQAYDFWDESIQGVANCLVSLRGTWYLAPHLYRWERQQLEKYVTPLKYGAGATLFLFLNFRVTGSPRFQMWRKQQMKMWRNNMSTSGSLKHTEGQIGGEKKAPQLSPPKGYLESKRERDVQNALSSLRVITDTLVSVSAGVSGTLWLLHAHQDSIRKDFEQAPLVSGRSVVADEMCTPFLRLTAAYASNNSGVNEKGGENINVETFLKFGENCRRRRDLEMKIRSELGVSKDTPVSVPYLGLERYRYFA